MGYFFFLMMEKLLFFVSALRALAVFVQSDTAQRTAVNGAFRLVFLRCSVHAACESQPGNIQLILQKLIDDLDHAFDQSWFPMSPPGGNQGKQWPAPF